MNPHEQLVNAIITFTELLKQSKTPCVATWKPLFITTCTDWCLYIETELALLDTKETGHIIKLAQEKSGDTIIPPPCQLLDALHVLFQSLIQNVFTSNSLYLYLIKNYRFLTIPEKDILFNDLTKISTKAATDTILSDILNELIEQ